jgi:FkbM family methyltransferase
LGRTPFFVSPESALSFWRFDMSRVDPFLLSMVHELVRPGITVWDIGANVGLFAFAAASVGATVVAVEPDTWLSSLLVRSTLVNRLPVTVISAAVSDSQGLAKLYSSHDGRASNSLIGKGSSQTVLTLTLDWLLNYFSAPQILKIDVEGLEYSVLKGGERVLQSLPTIVAEVTQNHEQIGALLEKVGYEFFAARASDRQPLRRPARDTLARPKR